MLAVTGATGLAACRTAEGTTRASDWTLADEDNLDEVEVEVDVDGLDEMVAESPAPSSAKRTMQKKFLDSMMVDFMYSVRPKRETGEVGKNVEKTRTTPGDLCIYDWQREEILQL